MKCMGIIQNVNSKRMNVIPGKNMRTGCHLRLGKVQFDISDKSSYQVNAEQTKVLYDKALEYAELKGDEAVIDAYCGVAFLFRFDQLNFFSTIIKDS